tara:strand:- start:175 stop:1590 length:1416 start_codon:yes stop_codon:yes gene_type:complete
MSNNLAKEAPKINYNNNNLNKKNKKTNNNSSKNNSKPKNNLKNKNNSKPKNNKKNNLQQSEIDTTSSNQNSLFGNIFSTQNTNKKEEEPIKNNSIFDNVFTTFESKPENSELEIPQKYTETFKANQVNNKNKNNKGSDNLVNNENPENNVNSVFNFNSLFGNSIIKTEKENDNSSKRLNNLLKNNENNNKENELNQVKSSEKNTNVGKENSFFSMFSSNEKNNTIKNENNTNTNQSYFNIFNNNKDNSVNEELQQQEQELEPQAEIVELNNDSGSFLRDLKNGNREFLNDKLRKNTSLLGMIKNILLGSLIFGVFVLVLIVIFFYYNQELLKNLINSISNYLTNIQKENNINDNNEDDEGDEEYTMPKSSKQVKKEELEKEIEDMEKNVNQEEINNNITKETNLKVDKENNDYQANDGKSTNSKIITDGRFCYIGENKGYRSCIELNVGDECMSGEIFPSMDICINPNLRI